MTEDDRSANVPDPATAPPPDPAARSTGTEPAARSTGTSNIPTWELLVLGAGALALIGSFLPFYTIDGGDIGGGAPDVNWTAWSNAVNLFPVTTLVVLYVVAAGVHIALGRFTQTSLPDRILGFDWSDLRLLLGGLATLTMLAYLLRSFPEGGVGKGIGLFIVLAAAIGLVVAAVMERQTRAQSSAAELAPAAATPGDWVVMGSGVALVIGSFLTVFDDDIGETFNAWESPLFPIYLIPVILGVVMAAQIAATTLASKGVPARVMGLETSALHRVFALHAALVMLGFLIGNALFDFAPEPPKGIGFWILLIASLGLVAGTYMREQPQTAADTT